MTNQVTDFYKEFRKYLDAYVELLSGTGAAECFLTFDIDDEYSASIRISRRDSDETGN